MYFQSSKCKKFIRLSPSSKKKHSKCRDLDASVPGSSSSLKSENGMANANVEVKVPNGVTDKDVGKGPLGINTTLLILRLG